MRLGEREQADIAADKARVREIVVPAEEGARQNRPQGERVSLWRACTFSRQGTVRSIHGPRNSNDSWEEFSDGSALRDTPCAPRPGRHSCLRLWRGHSGEGAAQGKPRGTAPPGGCLSPLAGQSRGSPTGQGRGSGDAGLWKGRSSPSWGRGEGPRTYLCLAPGRERCLG